MKEEIEKSINEICSRCHHSIGYCDCLDEEADTSDWAVPPETEKMLRERITNLEARLAEMEEKDRVVRGDPSRDAIFDWMNEHKDEVVKTLSDQNGEMEREIINLEAVLNKADNLRTIAAGSDEWRDYCVARDKSKPWITTERLTLAAKLPDVGEPGDDL